MKNETFEEFYDLAQDILKDNRLIGTQGHKRAKEFLLSLLEYKNIPFQVEEFYVEKFFPKYCKLLLNNQEIPCVAYLGSPPVQIKGFVKRNPIEGDIALCNYREERSVIKRALDEYFGAVVTYKENFNVHYYGYTREESVPVVNVTQEHAQLIEDSEVQIKIESTKSIAKCSNIIFEIGRGPIVYIVAHMDTKHEVFGSIDNGIGFLMLPFLYDELRRNFNIPYRFRFMITDAEEVGLEGSWFHVKKGLKHVFYCINIDSIGYSNPAVIYSDLEGQNGDRIMDMFYRHISDLRVDVDFRESKTASSDHIPFKRNGIQTLFLSSYPFGFRHTFYDILEAVDWDIVRMWFDVILSFLRRFHKL